MPDYLSKEEIKLWRSSLERITLEEYAARLGKSLCPEKETRDIVDIVMDYNPPRTISLDEHRASKEKIIEVAKKSIEIEKKIMDKPKAQKAKVQKNEEAESGPVFKKPLTERETLVYNYFLEHLGSVIYAKDLAKILNLPTDYVYKYIKNLRTKFVVDRLTNAEKGGYLLR